MFWDLLWLWWSTKTKGRFQIIAGDEPMLLERDSLHKLKVNWPAICHLASSFTLESVLVMHNTCVR